MKPVGREHHLTKAGSAQFNAFAARHYRCYAQDPGLTSRFLGASTGKVILQPTPSGPEEYVMQLP